MRQALLDSSLIARSSARRFVGLLAEIGGVAMISTSEVAEELPRAVRNTLESRASDAPLDQRLAETMREIAIWQEEYGTGALWSHIPTPRMPKSPRQAARVIAIGELWDRFVTDPDDLHLARSVVRHKLDALITTNLTLVGSGDWSSMMRDLIPDRPPVLCQKEKIIDWMLDQDQISRDPEVMTEYLLSALPPSDTIGARIRGWIKYLRRPFPEMAPLTEDYLSRIAPKELQRLHDHALADHSTPITRRVMQYPRP